MNYVDRPIAHKLRFLYNILYLETKKSNKPIIPALLFYGNRQWIVPPENVNFTKKSLNLLPTVLVPENYLETDDKNVRNKPPSLNPELASNEVLLFCIYF